MCKRIVFASVVIPWSTELSIVNKLQIVTLSSTLADGSAAIVCISKLNGAGGM